MVKYQSLPCYLSSVRGWIVGFMAFPLRKSRTVLSIVGNRSLCPFTQSYNISTRLPIIYIYVTRYPTGRREIKLLLLVFELTVSSRQKKWPLRKNVGHRGDKQMLVLGDLTQVAGHQEEEERIGDSLPSAEVNSKKMSFWAGSVAGRRTIAIFTPGGRQKNYWDTKDPWFFKPV